MTLVCFEHKFYFLCIKMEFQKVVNFLSTAFDDTDLPRFTKKWIEFHDQSEKKNTAQTKKSELKRQS